MNVAPRTLLLAIAIASLCASVDARASGARRAASAKTPRTVVSLREEGKLIVVWSDGKKTVFRRPDYGGDCEWLIDQSFDKPPKAMVSEDKRWAFVVGVCRVPRVTEFHFLLSAEKRRMYAPGELGPEFKDAQPAIVPFAWFEGHGADESVVADIRPNTPPVRVRVSELRERVERYADKNPSRECLGRDR